LFNGKFPDAGSELKIDFGISQDLRKPLEMTTSPVKAVFSNFVNEVRGMETNQAILIKTPIACGPMTWFLQWVWSLLLLQLP